MNSRRNGKKWYTQKNKMKCGIRQNEKLQKFHVGAFTLSLSDNDKTKYDAHIV